MLLEIVRSLGLTKKISSADLRADLRHRGEPHRVDGSDPQARGARGGAPKTRHPRPVLPGPLGSRPVQNLPFQPPTSPTGNGADQPR